jgi:predicted ATPase/class 3 adenylate cyclase
LVSANHPVSAEQLIEDVWDGSPPLGANQTLQSHISALRRLLGGDRIHYSPNGYSIEVASGALDTDAFEADTAQGIEAFATGDLKGATELLDSALTRWRGTALADVTDSAWSVPVRARLDELRLTCLETQHDVLLALGRHEQVVVSAEAAVLEQPLREGLWKGLMLALYRCSRQVDALRAYERLRRTLAEIGILPSPHLIALNQAILEQSAELEWHAPEPRSDASVNAQTEAGGPMAAPAGIVTLLFTDIEGSTRMWEEHAATMSKTLIRHDELIRRALRDHSGYIFKTVGDAFCAAFATASDAVRAAIALQRTVWAEDWPEECDVRVRVALHTGECDERDGDYFGPPVNRVARLVSSAHGGQTFLSRVTAEFVGGSLPPGVTLKDLGILRLKDLGQPEQVFQLDVTGLPSDFPALGLVHRGYDDLPAELTSLIGREELVDQLLEAVQVERLITLTGPGGVGKTRLAIRVANCVRGPFEDGVRFVDLSVIPSEGCAADLILSSLHGVSAKDEPSSESVIRVLGPARLLLVLDNCEHQLNQIRGTVASVLQKCPWVHILATSRQALEVGGEHRIDVPELEQPRSGSANTLELQTNPAARLFEMHARMVDSHFTVTAANATAVTEICRRVGGLPLAIELAARQLDIVTIEELAQEAVGEQILSRLAIEGGLEQRLGSIAASLRWSLNLLSDADRLLFTSLGVFASAFTRDQALDLVDARSSSEMTRSFDRLVRLSLVTRDSPGTARFKLFEPTKEFAISLLDSTKRRSLQRRHARVMRDAAERISPLLRTDREADACAQLSADFPDHRQAVAWYFDHSVDDAARMVLALFQFCQFQMLSEANEWAMRLTRLMDDESPMTTPICGAAALGSWFAGDVEGAIALGERAVRAATSPYDPSALWAHVALIDAKVYSGRLGEIGEHFKAIASYSSQSGDKFWQINSFGFFAISRLFIGDIQGAMREVDRAIALARELNNPDCTHWAMHCLGRVLAVSDPEAACVAFEEAMGAAGSVGSRWHLSLDLLEWSGLKRQLNDIPRAAQGLLELLELLVASGNRSQRSQFYLETARVLGDQGEIDAAFTIMAARTGMPAMPVTPAASDESLAAQLEDALGRRATHLRVRAHSLRENDLIVLCRSQLEAIVEGQRLSMVGAPNDDARENSRTQG